MSKILRKGTTGNGVTASMIPQGGRSDAERFGSRKSAIGRRPQGGSQGQGWTCAARCRGHGGGACRRFPFIPAADPPYAIMFIPSSARLAAPATEPTLAVSAPSGGPSSRLVTNLENGQTLVGNPGLALTGDR